jgi:hypothetical protein
MTTRCTGFFLSAIAALCLATAASAQLPKYTQAGPIPSELMAARTIFVSNGGADSWLFKVEQFPGVYSGDTNRAFTELYAALKATGDFTLVDDPSKADLVLELSQTGASYVGSGGCGSTLRLVVYDRKTNYVLWTINQYVYLAFRRRTADRNFDRSLTKTVNQFLAVAGKPLVPDVPRRRHAAS